jgi:hypothetical protein
LFAALRRMQGVVPPAGEALSVVLLPAANVGSAIVRAGEYYSIDRNDYVLLRSQSTSHLQLPTDWAQVTLLFRYKDLEFAQVAICERALESAGNDPLCPLTCAPRLKISQRRLVVPVQDIWQLVHVINIPNSRHEFWVNWFVFWGPAAYPAQHFDEVLTRHRFHVSP